MNRDDIARVHEFNEATDMIPRDEAAIDIGNRLATREYWLVVAAPPQAAIVARSLTEDMANVATAYCDIGLSTVMRVRYCAFAVTVVQAYAESVRMAVVVTLPKAMITREHVERLFPAVEWPTTPTLQDTVLLRSDPNAVQWPTLFVDAVMLTDPELGLHIIDLCREYETGETPPS